jgi:hypothetical protein
MKTKLTIKFITILGFVCVVTVSLYYGSEYYKYREVQRGLPKVYAIDTVMPPVNFGDDREFVGAADNVFVGKVIEQSGTIGRRGNPETQFAVNVILNIKGDLPKETTVNQLGGYKNGVLYVLNEGEKAAEYLLAPGSTYLFATRAEKHTLTFWPYAAELLSSDKNLSYEDLLKIVQNNKRITNLLIAYPDEILMGPDILHNRTPNSFQSLSTEEQDRIKAEVAQMQTQEAPVPPTTTE